MVEKMGINERTGLDEDAFNHYQALMYYFYGGGMLRAKSVLLERSPVQVEDLFPIYVQGGIEEITRQVMANPIKKYAEKFPSDEYGTVVNQRNADAITEFDQLAEAANGRLSNEGWALQDLVRIIQQAHRVIYGREMEIKTLSETFYSPDFKLIVPPSPLTFS